MKMSKENITKHIEFYLAYQKNILANATVKSRKEALGMFHRFCRLRDKHNLTEINRKLIESYAIYVHQRKNKKNSLLSVSRKRMLLTSIKLFFRWLFTNGIILINPAFDLIIPKSEKKLPRNILSVEEIENMCKVIDLTTIYGERDRAILEVFYSTGIRRKELSHLKINDLDCNRQTVYVRHGKGNKQRIVPIGKRAIKWVLQYTQNARPELLKNRIDEAYLFITNRTEKICVGYLSMLISNYREQAGIKKKGACHMLRHSMATHMHKNNAGIKSIKEILGHQRISTTEIYTRVDITDLKEVYERCHPSIEAEL